ncbi:hypothetical protein [Candidatus Phytoplasma pruni]|uniref:Uncharacterized protein n=1 Tax=Candidatus Phytoplasma pruni TaxID=479893 RepID=A0A851HG28_9MOLU|nr:hypothetical protein [Candidatus Phytoplasma pruni]NWN45590.1 hypothetical protein [Candidatus Phytoplasma pruni]
MYKNNFKNKFLFVFVLFSIFFFNNNYQIIAFSPYQSDKYDKNSKTKIHHILLEQHYPAISKEELVNFYAEDQLNKKIKINRSEPCYNALSNPNLDAKIKNPPSNLLGIYFDGGTREFKDNYFSLDELKKMQNNVDNIYIFYDNTKYCDTQLKLQVDKKIYFETFKKNWVVPSEWRPWFWSYEKWRNRWYDEKTPNEKGYFLNKYGSQGFQLDINVKEEEKISSIPLYTIEEILNDNEHFYKIKNFTFKENLGNGIHVDYNKNFLTLKTDNSVGDFFNTVYNIGGYVPIVGTVLSGIEFIEGTVREDEGQMIESGVSLAVDAATFGAGKIFFKGGKKIATKGVSKGIAKNVAKKTVQQPFKRVAISFTAKQMLNILKTDMTIKTGKLLKDEFVKPKPIELSLNDNVKIIIFPREEKRYEIDPGDAIVIVDHEGNVLEN